ncbi:hypothetical protein [Staphylococcus aureus]|uniref:hypothetical protein n=1 Tax=Staphylococcus aureus TaxID=1280 RepID=UPI001642901E
MKNCIDCDVGNGIVVKGNGGGKKRIKGCGILKGMGCGGGVSKGSLLFVIKMTGEISLV